MTATELVLLWIGCIVAFAAVVISFGRKILKEEKEEKK